MEKTRKRRPLSVKILAAIGILVGGFLFSMLILSAARPRDVGYVRLRVSDALTDMPIEGALVSIPETGKTFTTDKNGRTEIITVPIIKDAHLNSLLTQNSGTITVLVSHKNYRPYALFYAATTKNTLRDNLGIYLFSGAGLGLKEPTTVIEAPDDDWVKELLKKYGV